MSDGRFRRLSISGRVQVGLFGCAGGWKEIIHYGRGSVVVVRYPRPGVEVYESRLRRVRAVGGGCDGEGGERKENGRKTRHRVRVRPRRRAERDYANAFAASHHRSPIRPTGLDACSMQFRSLGTLNRKVIDTRRVSPAIYRCLLHKPLM